MQLQMFIPLTKVDEVQRLVYGVATAEVLDKSGELMDYETTKPFFQKWSAEFEKITDGKSLGNVRAMHGKVAAGKLTAINFNDDVKQIEVCTKVVDDAEWTKVLEGVYTGFSAGGNYVKRWKDGAGTQRYTAEPHEVSLVDNPCVPTATFSMIKADGSTLQKSFKSIEAPATPAPAAAVTPPANDAVLVKAVEMAKAAGKSADAAPDFFDAARAELTKVAPAAEAPPAEPAATPRAPSVELEQVWKAKDGATFAKKADAIAHNEKIDAEAAKQSNPLTKALGELEAAVQAKEQPAAPAPGKNTDGVTTAPVAKVEEPKPTMRLAKIWSGIEQAGEKLKKGMYTISQLASLISSLDWLQQEVLNEQIYEGDNSTLPAKLKADVAALCATLRAMVVEETAELVGEEAAVLEAGAGLSESSINALRKVCAALEGDDGVVKGRIEKAAPVLAKLSPAKPVAPAIDEPMAKVTAENAELKKQIGDALPVIDALKKRVDALEAQPMPPKAPTRVVEKSEDGEIQDLVKAGPDAMATALIKAAQQNPRVLFRAGPAPAQTK